MTQTPINAAPTVPADADQLTVTAIGKIPNFRSLLVPVLRGTSRRLAQEFLNVALSQFPCKVETRWMIGVSFVPGQFRFEYLAGTAEKCDSFIKDFWVWVRRP
jgi:hypothetical protein